MELQAQIAVLVVVGVKKKKTVDACERVLRKATRGAAQEGCPTWYHHEHATVPTVSLSRFASGRPLLGGLYELPASGSCGKTG